MSRSQPYNRRRLVPCHCSEHKGQHIHYKKRQRCEAQLVLDRIQPPAADPGSPAHMYSDDDGMSDDIDSEQDSLRHQEVSTADEVHTLCFRQFAAMLDHNMTEDGVTANLQAWLSSIKPWLPLEVRAEIPRTYKGLMGHFRKSFLAIDRLPVCPAECSLLDHVEPSLTYVCHCDGKGHYPWRSDCIFDTASGI